MASCDISKELITNSVDNTENSPFEILDIDSPVSNDTSINNERADSRESVHIPDSLHNFSIDYCKRNVTKCLSCKKQIEKGKLRIGKRVIFKKKVDF